MKYNLWIKRIVCCVFILTVILCADIKDIQAALKGNDTLYIGYIYTDSRYPGEKLPFRIYAPSDYKTKSYPLVLHLNGEGENGLDNEKQITYRNTMTKLLIKDENRQNYPCIIIAPQCPQGELWVTDFYNKPSKAMDMTIGLLELICNQYNVDNNRLYVTGYSTGAEGAWDTLYRYPNMFAAAIPFAGCTAPGYAKKIKNVPIWVFHSKDDEDISVSESENMVDALKKAGSKVVKFTEKNGEHASAWMYAYNDANLLPWLFAQKNLNPIMPQSWQTESGNTPVPDIQTAIPGVSDSATELLDNSVNPANTGTQDTAVSPRSASTLESKIEPFPTEEEVENKVDIKPDNTWLFIILPVILVICAGAGIYFLKIRRK